MLLLVHGLTMAIIHSSKRKRITLVAGCGSNDLHVESWQRSGSVHKALLLLNCYNTAGRPIFSLACIECWP